MKVLIVGLGSMGKRRLRLLQHFFHETDVAGVDGQRSRRAQAGIQTYEHLDAAITEFKPDAALICTSPLAHAELISACLARGLHVFTEINLVANDYEKNMNLAKENERTLFLSSTFLYRNEVQAIRAAVAADASPKLYTYHVGQYLPDWHPWESYKDFFLSDKRTNGCREILTINMPWLVKTFGEIEQVSAVRRKLSTLDVEYPDSYVVTFTHEGGSIGVFTVDLITREAVCALRVESENLLMTWNGKPDGLCRFDAQEKTWRSIETYTQVDRLNGYSANIIENAYLAELEAFFRQIEGTGHALYGFADDKKVLQWIDRIEDVKA